MPKTKIDIKADRKVLKAASLMGPRAGPRPVFRAAPPHRPRQLLPYL